MVAFVLWDGFSKLAGESSVHPSPYPGSFLRSNVRTSIGLALRSLTLIAILFAATVVPAQQPDHLTSDLLTDAASHLLDAAMTPSIDASVVPAAYPAFIANPSDFDGHDMTAQATKPNPERSSMMVWNRPACL
jgi:hypothetical protein